MKNGLKEFKTYSMDSCNSIYDTGEQFGFRVWSSKKTPDLSSLKNEKLFHAYPEAIEEATYIDCIWFKGEKEMPAVFKICDEHNFMEALCRLKNLKELLPPYPTIFILVTSRTIIDIVKKELNKPVFANFSPRIISNSENDFTGLMKNA